VVDGCHSMTIRRLDAALRGGCRTIGRKGGQSLVEFAFIGIPLVLVLSATVDIGRFFYYDVTVRNAAREGARYAITADSSSASFTPSVKATVKRAAPGLSIPDGNITISPTTPASQQQVTVSVTYDVNFFTPMVKAVLGSTEHFTRSATMQML